MTDNSTEKLAFDKLLALIAERAMSEPGRKLVEDIRIYNNIPEITQQQQKISSIKTLIEEGQDLPPLNVSDLSQEIERCKVEGTFFTVEALNEIYKLIRAGIEIKDFYRNHKKSMQAVSSIAARIASYPDLIEAIEKVVDEKGEIKDKASKKLKKIRRDKVQAEQNLRAEVNRAMQKARDNNWLHEKNPTIRNGRYVLPLKAKAKRKVKGIVHGESGSGATTYVEPISVIEVNNELKDLEQQEKNEIRRILIELTSKIRPVFTNLERNIKLIAELDKIRASAVFAIEFNCHPPQVYPDDEKDQGIVLRNAKHPLLSLRKDVVPLNFEPPENIRTVIITGPNAGGKTVAMKTVGLLSKMAMCGLHIPADAQSKIPYLDQFLMDIGDRQSIEDDLSTFSAHISSLKKMLHQATENTLVLIDELGTGTDPLEGSSLGQAILEELLKIGAYTITTTHHSSLKAFGDKNEKVVNAAMEFNTRTLNPMYRLSIGLPGSSYALEIANRLGIDEKIINRARELMDSDTVKLENLLMEVEEEKAELEKEKKKLSRRKKTLDKVVDNYDNRVASIKEKEKKLDSALSEELEKVVKESRARIEKAIKDIREQKADKKTIKKAQKTVKKIQKKATKKKKKVEKKTKPKITVDEKKKIEPGNWVKIEPFNQVGQIKEIRGKKVSVDIDGKMMQVRKDNLVPIKPPKKERESTTEVNVEANTTAELSLNLRGLRYEEARAQLIRYLDRVVMSGLNEVEIVHGKGDGVLRKMTHDVLSNNPNVTDYYHRKPRAGGTGVTVVKF
ncbi:MAG: endonuclease MutS2 [Candidatus Marinimicrobia bacterium]|nr:endonuclease MutS2 [Candidatus Neomarinimicrobiota bacterium]